MTNCERALAGVHHGPPASTAVHCGPMMQVGRVRVEPGAQYEREFVLDKWYSFITVGTYQVCQCLSFAWE
jgi:hypothetical protein